MNWIDEALSAQNMNTAANERTMIVRGIMVLAAWTPIVLALWAVALKAWKWALA